jgi:hypothetical protein
MKKLIYLLVFISVHVVVFSQTKLRDGIYLVDQSEKGGAINSDRAFIQYNPFFVEDEPEAYDPIAIYTDDFVPLELSDMPIVQHKKDQQNLLLVHLTEGATEKLREFTSRNVLNNIVVVVNDQALAVYKIVVPVNSGFIKVTKCNDDACNQVYRRLKSTVKI